MGFRINTNIAAMNAHTNASMNNRNLDNSLNKLSSGLRINTAADDSSGLAIANSLRSQASSLGQAVSNGNDAVGLLQTADGALSEYANILDTIKTKSVQAASDGQNTASRLSIQKDIDALMEELNIIATTTSFNGQKLLSGTFSNKEFQMGANANESVKINIGSTETSQIGQTTRATMDIVKIGDNQLTLKSATTGKELTLDPINLQYNNDPENGMGAVAAQINKYSGETGITAKAITETTTGVISAGTTSTDFSINGINVGAIQVDVNDAGGTLQNAINSKTNETGVSASRTSDGQLELTAQDGRAIQISGISDVTALGDSEMSTLGHLEVVQAGSSDFQISGAKTGSATGGDIDLTGSMATLEDSVLTLGSKFGAATTFAEGTEIGMSMTLTLGMSLANASSTADMTAARGSTIKASSTINKDTLLTTAIVNTGSVSLSSDMLLKAGSILQSGSVFDAGTKIEQDIVDNAGKTHKAGSILVSDVTTTGTTTLTKDMIMFVDVANSANASVASGSTFEVGSVLGADVKLKADTVLKADMVLKEGSVLLTGSELTEGSVLGQSVALTANTILTTTAETNLKAGSVLGSSSELDKGSTVGGVVTAGATVTASEEMLLKAGSVIASGSTLKKGTVLLQDLSSAEVGNGNGLGLKAGTVLGEDITTTADISLSQNMTLAKDSTLLASSKIATNLNTGANSVELSDREFTSLSDINVTTLEGAMKAIDTVSAAIGNLDTIRSSIGSAQNQVVSTINNISVTQVNVKAAESTLRDVDFAQESANFSKFNILAQSGSYAMSQANAVQQNVMRLLQ